VALARAVDSAPNRCASSALRGGAISKLDLTQVETLLSQALSLSAQLEQRRRRRMRWPSWWAVVDPAPVAGEVRASTTPRAAAAACGPALGLAHAARPDRRRAPAARRAGQYRRRARRLFPAFR
jgi:multidrug efflux system outer membrane protein